MSKIIKIDLMRQGAPTIVEQQAYANNFPNQEIVYGRIDPTDYIEHYKACDDRKPTLVQLPKEHPIPHLAMHKYPHVVVTPDGRIMRLKSIKAEFEQIYPPE